jgi:hypothetical protein
MEFKKEMPFRHKKKAHLHLQKAKDILIKKKTKTFLKWMYFLINNCNNSLSLLEFFFENI